MTSETTTTTTLPLSPGRWAVDLNHSTVGFVIRHLGISKVRGRFGEFEAGLVIGDTAEECAVAATVVLASIDTGNSMRDEHVLGAEMLDAERRKTMTFRSTGVRGQDQDWFLDGEVTIGEVTRPVTFEVDFGGVQDFSVDGRGHAGFEARGEIRRSDFDLGFGAVGAVLGDVVKVELDLQFVAPQ